MVYLPLRVTPISSPSVDSTPSPTELPTQADVLPTATEEPSATPTFAPPVATATEAPTLPPTPEPTPTAACDVAIHADLLKAYEEAGGKSRLGCPYTPAEEEPWGAQRFERGVMLWRGTYRTIYIGRADGSFIVTPDEWGEDTPEYFCHIEAPEGLRQPKRGFGLVWCRSEMERDALGFAIEEEYPVTGLTQQFEGGLLFGEADRPVRAFYSDGTWTDLGSE